MFKAVVPARYASTRLPGKPLLDIAGKPMVVRVAEQALQSDAEEVVVATDHPAILNACEQHGIRALMTRDDWPTGTDRISEVSRTLDWTDETVVVNVQGDEPLIKPQLINQVAQALIDGQDDMATCGHDIHDWTTFLDPNVVKIVTSQDMRAMYFSRAPIPWPRDLMNRADRDSLPCRAIRHIGMYAYRGGFLRAYPELPAQQVEELESLEQLRALACGFTIKVCMIQDAPEGGVDTEADLARVRRAFADRLGT